MTLEFRPKRRKNADFWRAVGFLRPHWKIVAVSVACAFIVGIAFTSGLSTMLPIMQVLIKGDSVQAWVDRQIAQKRLDVKLADDPDHITIIRNTGANPLSVGEQITGVNQLALPGPVEGERTEKTDRRRAAVILHALVDPNVQTATVNTLTKSTPVALGSVPRYLALAESIAARLPNDPVWSIAAVFGILAALAIFGNIMRFFQEYLADKASILAMNDVRRKLYDHVLHIPLGFFGLKGTSDVTSRLTQDTAGLMEGFKSVLGKAIQEPINAVMAFALAVALSWKLTIFIIVFAPLMVVLIAKFGRKMRRANRKALQNSSSMLAQLEGTLIGIRVVKAASAERFERRRYRGIMQKLINEHLRMARLDAMSAPILESLTLVMVGIIVLYAAYMVLESKTSQLTPGEFMLVMACLASMGESLRKVTKVNNALQKSNAAAARIFETFSIPIERRRTRHSHFGQDEASSKSPPVKQIKLRPLQREVRFENITFTYPNGTVPAVNNVSLTVPKGQSIAVVGRNGSGKTTLLALLPRFYDPQQGRILIDGIDITNATLRSLRQQIGIVTQDSVIFPGSIADNIAYGMSNPNRDRVIAAAKRAFAHEFITEKKESYDTVLGEHGAQLSGGQKQRLCIARAIYRASPILILDEATSQVDAESEHLIQQAIESMMQERTTFVIAHRFSTILSADSIVVMERGKIVAQGKHEELLLTCPLYRQLYERQLFTGAAAVTSDTAS